MDGTLLNEHGELDKEFFTVFKKLMKKDIKFVVASGRQYNKLSNIFKAISDDVIYIAENGTIVKYKEQELYSSTLNREQTMELIKECVFVLPKICLVGVVWPIFFHKNRAGHARQ